jgi:hypothetical protein
MCTTQTYVQSRLMSPNLPPQHNDHNTRWRRTAAPQRLSHLSLWNHLPWPQIMAPKLPMSLMQAPSSAGSFMPLSFPFFGALKHGPWKMRLGGGGSLLCGRRSFARSDNQPNVIVGGQDGFGEEMRRRWDVWGGC